VNRGAAVNGGMHAAGCVKEGLSLRVGPLLRKPATTSRRYKAGPAIASPDSHRMSVVPPTRWLSSQDVEETPVPIAR